MEEDLSLWIEMKMQGLKRHREFTVLEKVDDEEAEEEETHFSRKVCKNWTWNLSGHCKSIPTQLDAYNLYNSVRNLWEEELFTYFEKNVWDNFLEAEKLLRVFTKASTPTDILERFNGVLSDEMVKNLDTQTQSTPAEMSTSSAAPTVDLDPLGVAAEIAKKMAEEVEGGEEE